MSVGQLSAPGTASKQAGLGPLFRVIISCSIGMCIEWYDFVLYGFLAPSVFDKVFFPKLDPTVGTISIFGIFAAGFLARPLGGLSFSHFGDRKGRKPAMIGTLVLIGVSTTAMGLIPDYNSIGLGAPLLLTILRFLQGFALGGESAGAPILALESAPERSRGLVASIIQGGGIFGIVLATVIVGSLSSLPEQQMLAWGWRIPLLASAIIVLVGYYIRQKVEESPKFLNAIAADRPVDVPVFSVLQSYKKSALIVFFCTIAESSLFYFATAFALSYAIQTLHIERSLLFRGLFIGNCIGILANPAFGHLSDKIGRRPVLLASFSLAALYVAFVFFPLLGTGNPTYITLAMAIPGALLQPMTFAPEASFYAELFSDTRIRFTGVSVGRQFGAIFGGGLMPVIATTLAAMSGGITSVIVYFVFISVLAIIAVLVARETRTQPI
jgi:MFS family permease